MITPQRLQGFGNDITIPISSSQYISLTERNTLLLPTNVLTWTLGGWAGYHDEEPAIRYGIQSEELFGRRVTFAGDPGIALTDVVIQGTAGSVSPYAGDSPLSSDADVASRSVAFPSRATSHPRSPTATCGHARIPSPCAWHSSICFAGPRASAPRTGRASSTPA